MEQLTRAEATAAFTKIQTELTTIADTSHRDTKVFIADHERITQLADRGALLIPAIPIALDLLAVWGYVDRGILPEDGGAAIHAFQRRLLHYLGATRRLLDILQDDLLWRVHARTAADAVEARKPDEKPIVLKPPRPTLFVGSTVEALDVARAVHDELDYDIEVTIWNHQLFEARAVTGPTF